MPITMKPAAPKVEPSPSIQCRKEVPGGACNHDLVSLSLTLMLGLGLSAAAPSMLNAQESKADGLAPFGGKPQTIPGTVEFENFDEGAEGVAYHDIDAPNDPKPIAYRKTTVDLEATPDKKIILVGHIKAGEWMKYTVDVTKSGAYELELSVAVQGDEPPEIRLECDGLDVSGPIRLTTTTSGWDRFTRFAGPTVNLEGGRHVLRVVVVKSPKGTSLNLDYVRFVAKRETKKS
jgi:hypothetical protein